MARTNKMGIAKKKAMQAKQKKLMVGSGGTEGGDGVISKTDIENPKGNNYTRFLRSGKYICDSTTVREDPDGYRVLRKANKGEIEYKFLGSDAWGYRKYTRKIKIQNSKNRR